MKTKRLLALILAVLTLCTLTACNKKQSGNDEIEDANVETTPTFNLGGYEEAKELTRWYDEFADKLIPSEEYGELIPFMGEVEEYTDYFLAAQPLTTRALYGLCTKDGKIVVDAVFTEILYNDGYYMLKTKPVEDNILCEYYLVDKNGTSVVKMPEKAPNVSYCGNGIYTIGAQDGTLGAYYDTKGNLIFEGTLEEPINPLGDGMFVLGVARENEYGYDYYLINNKKEKVSTVYSQIKRGTKGKYIVQDKETGLYGIIDSTGKVVVDIDYNFLKVNNDVFVLVKNNLITVMDKDLKVTSSFTVDKEVKQIFMVSPFVVEIDNVYYNNYGEKIDYRYLYYYDGYYDYYENETTFILDDEFKKVEEIDGEYMLVCASDNKNKLFLGKMETGEEYNIIYDLENHKIIAEDVTYGDNFLEEFYYKTDEDGKTKAYILDLGKEIGETKGICYKIESSIGSIYSFELDGVAYTLNENYEKIFNTKTDK